MKQPVYDLFGDVTVTTQDIEDWVAAVAPRWNTERAFDRYVKTYDVPAKIRAAKIDGTFDDIVTSRRNVWHKRLSLDVVNN